MDSRQAGELTGTIFAIIGAIVAGYLTAKYWRKKYKRLKEIRPKTRF